MDQDKFYKGIEDLKKIGLSAEQKQIIFNRLNYYAANKTEEKTINKQKNFWSLFLYSGQFSYIALAVVVLIGGGLVVASDNSLPGELLYTLKVNVREPLQGVATFGTASKVSWEAEKVQTRLEEVEVLAAQGKLNASVREEAQNRLDKQTRSFYKVAEDSEEKNIKEAKKTGIVQLDLESKINAHDRILEKLGNHSDSDQKEEIVKFRAGISGNVSGNTSKNVSADMGVMMMSAEAKVTKNIEIDRLVNTGTFEEDEKTIETLIKNTEENLNKNLEATSTLEADIMLDTKNDLDFARDALEEARRKRDSGDMSGAEKDLQNSRRSIENAEIFLRQSIRLGKEKERSIQ